MSDRLRYIETVVCSICGVTHLKRNCCGVKYGGRETWTCSDCIVNGAMDRVFTPIGTSIDRFIAASKENES